MKEYIAITWHREKFLKNIWEIEKQIIDILNKFFYDKNRFIFKIWWCDWIDNIFWHIAIELWYSVELYIPKFDINWRKY